MHHLSRYLMAFNDQATAYVLKTQLESLANHWERLKLSAPEEYKVRHSEQEPLEGTDEGEWNGRGNVEGPELKRV
ncbi:Hypothetical protein FKW44_002207 [Caligus rogercresseyi]|uniref:Uncharacterized protein n=1 Tax=Caligus rogercresseyi TaxID=217165 RepID=A0A7T8KK38_CALRO|nr:Hypothetical protein FKW44_002207 [Caligus rogercresseyi]